jgi:carboxyl-terminal processing protease
MKVLSYILTALVASAATLGVVILLVGNRDSYTKLEQLADLIEDKFIGQEDIATIEDAAANAMVHALGDRWSYYMTAQEYKSYQEQMANAYVGIGVTVQQRQDGIGLDVTQVTKGGPALEAGVQAGDVIVGVDGKDITGMALADVSAMIKGEAGTKVTLTIQRGQEKLTISVTRRSIQTPVATGTMLEGNIGLVRIVNFDSRCAEETIAQVEKLLGQGAQKLIFDVRYNPGGYKKELVNLLNYLLPEGLLFRSEYYDGTVQDDHSDKACLNVPMVVLVNGSSYSAAEFFAAALRDYDWATVVGTQTCGKGYFQNTFVLNDGSAVALSVGKYYTPKGVSLAEVGGLTPDKIVEVTNEQADAIYAGTIDPMEDPQILAAIEKLDK